MYYDVLIATVVPYWEIKGMKVMSGQGLRSDFIGFVKPLMLLMVFLAAAPFAALAATRTPSAIVIDEATGDVLFARGADRQGYPASLTKVMTLYLTFEALANGKLRMDQKLPVSHTAASRSPTKLWLAPGDAITVKDAILALVTHSANDAATVLSEALGGTERKFSRLMTEKAEALGMTRTTFRNASGLPNRAQFSTPRDMAVLGVAIRRDFPQYYGLFSTKSFTYKGRTYRNHNRLLGNFAGVDGIKTGYTAASGFNLVTSAERDGKRLVGVVFGGQTAAARDAYMRSILENAFDRDSAAAGKVQEAVFVPVPASTQKAASQQANATQTASPASSGGRQWGVQVGAFRNYSAAHKLAIAAANDFSAREQVTVAVASTSKKARRPMYRARLIGFSSPDDARKACSELKQKNYGCLPVAM